MTKRTIERQGFWISALAMVLLAGCLSASAWAAPRAAEAEGPARAFDPVFWVGQWFDQVATGLDSIWQRGGCRLEPDGSTCPDDATSTVPQGREVEDTTGGARGSADGAAPQR